MHSPWTRLPVLPQTRECPDDFLEPFSAYPGGMGTSKFGRINSHGGQNAMKATITILVLAAAFSSLQAQQSSSDLSEKNSRLFTTETFGGNGRTCQTCHSSNTGTISPQDAQRRYRRNPSDPLFLFDGSDDGQGHGVDRMLTDATVLVQIPLPANVSVGDDPRARSVVLRRGTPTTLNTPALDPVLMLDGRDPNLPTQALHAIQAHFQPTRQPTQADLLGISQFELTAPFFSSLRLLAVRTRRPAPGAAERELRILRSEAGSSLSMRHLFQEGRRVLAPSAIAARCSIRPTHLSLRPPSDWSRQGHVFRASASRSSTRLRIPSTSSIGLNPDGTQTVVWSPDPGRALITGRIDQPGPASDLNSFKIPTLWGVKNTAPYFHDNSAKTLADVAAHYARFFLTLPDPVQYSRRRIKRT